MDRILEKTGRKKEEAIPNDALWAWYVATAKLLKMKSGEDVISTFSMSFRSLEDLQASMRLGEKHMDICLAMREWWEVVPSHAHGEYRAFVHKKQLNAVTQYLAMIEFPKLQVKERVKRLKKRFPLFSKG